MFIPKTDRIQDLVAIKPTVVAELEQLFGESARMYIDYANVRP